MKKSSIKKRIISILLCSILLLGLLPTLTPHEVHAATASQNNIVARADYMYNITWTAKSTVYGWRYNYTFYAGNTYRIPYGQPVTSGYYIGYGVSVDDFITAANTAGSIFYTSRSTYSSTGSSSVYYANDCSAFVSWCWGVSRKTTYSIPQISTYLGMATTSNTSLLQLGDALNSNDVGHVVLVTDLVYNSSGTLTSIEITEQTPPQLKRSYFTPSELGAKYGSYYGIYRYSGTVPAAPASSSSGSSSSGSSSSSSSTITTKYYPACASSCSTLYEGMANIGVTLNWDLQCEIAEANGITDFSGTADQNTTMLTLLKAGTLLNPNYTGVEYYPACSSSCATLYEGMADIGVTLDWTLQCQIAEANGITDFSGTVDQNTTLLNLLKAGLLVMPNSSSITNGDVSDSIVDGKNGYDRGYAGGKNGTGEYKAFGLDVSSWQGSDLDFEKIKAGGYDYVILRAGTSKGKDTEFENYYAKAKAAGLDVGAYYYSYAYDTTAVLADAENMMSYISGKVFEYPIYFDFEEPGQQDLAISNPTLARDIILTFLDALAEEGYLVGLYSGLYFSSLLPMDEICERYEFWMAHYLEVGTGDYDGTNDYTVYGPTYSTTTGMYQFTNSVWIGDYGYFDGDLCYKDYPAIVKEYGFNGYAPQDASTDDNDSSGSTDSGSSGGSSYIDSCTFYNSHCTFSTTKDTTIYSEPHTAKDTNNSVALESIPSGTVFYSTGLYQNTAGNLYYQVETSDGQVGYLAACYTTFIRHAITDLKYTDYEMPECHLQGNSFPVTGTVSSTYNQIYNVKAYVYPGFIYPTTSDTPSTGTSQVVNGYEYVLDGSAVDDAVTFGILEPGQYTFQIAVNYTAYYAVSSQEVASYKRHLTLELHYFCVVDEVVDTDSCTHQNTTYEAKTPTCTTTGYSATSCSLCGLTTRATLPKASHTYGSYTTTAEATCTTEGSKEATCTVCSTVNTEAIPATGHTWDSASCTSAATCTVCGSTTGEALGHTWTVATCTTPQSCATCGTTSGEALGHSWADATCSLPKRCTTCGETSGSELGHTYTSVVHAPQCLKDGYTVYTCSVCDYSYQSDFVTATGHNWTTATCTDPMTCSTCGTTTGSAIGHSYSSVVTTPECMKDGYTTHTCTICGDSYKDSYVTASGHSWNNATCTDPMTCATCGTTTGSALGHSYKSVVTDPECMKDGYTTHTCTICGDSYKDSYVTASGHSWTDATCTTPMTCATCGTTTGSALGHSYKSVVTDPECLKDGYTTHTCSVCGDSYKDSYVTASGHSWTAATCTAPMTCSSCGTTSGSAMGHNYAGGTCTSCGAADPDYVEPVVVPTMGITGAALNFEAEIMYNIYFTATDMTDVVEMGLITFDTKLTDGTIDNAVAVIPGYYQSGSEYVVHTNGIPAKNLGDAVYFKAYAKLSDGSYAYSGVAGYHAVLYAQDILANSTSQKMKNLVIAMLNYGAAAQTHFEYKTDSLMNAVLTDAQKASINGYSADMADSLTAADSAKLGNFTKTGGFTGLSPSVAFEGAFAINFYLTTANAMDGDLTFYYWKMDDYAAADVLTADNASGVVTATATSSGELLAVVEGIAAKEIDQTVYISAVYESNGVRYCTGVIAYSLATYCKDMISMGAATMQNFAAETIVYGYYAKQYFA